MSTQSPSVSETANRSTTLLRRALQGNGLFSAFSGLALLLGAGPLSAFLGITPPRALSISGVLLLLYGADLLYVARRDPPRRALAQAAVFLDVLWVAGSALILWQGWLPLTTAGRWAVILVAEVVALFAIVQAVGIRRMDDHA